MVARKASKGCLRVGYGKNGRSKCLVAVVCPRRGIGHVLGVHDVEGREVADAVAQTVVCTRIQRDDDRLWRDDRVRIGLILGYKRGIAHDVVVFHLDIIGETRLELKRRVYT